jgi:hypothetical protein
MKKQHYNARWGKAGFSSIANVSYEASHDANAIKRADKIARELGVTNTPRTITRNGILIEILNTGLSKK